MMLQWLVNEFVAIMDFLMKQENCQKYKGFVLIEKPELEVLLDKNKYETSYHKLMLWKQLHWIDAEQERLTKRVYNKSHGTQQRMIKMEIKVYEILTSMDTNP